MVNGAFCLIFLVLTLFAAEATLSANAAHHDGYMILTVVLAIPTALLAVLALCQASDALKRRRLRRSVHSARRGWERS